MNRLFFFPLSQNTLAYLMIAFTLQKWLKAYFPFSIFKKFRGILNYSCCVTKWLEASLPFSVGAKFRRLIQKKIVWFQNQGALFLDLFSFETQQCESSLKIALGVRNLKKSKKSAPWVRNQTISCESSIQIKCAWISNRSPMETC